MVLGRLKNDMVWKTCFAILFFGYGHGIAQNVSGTVINATSKTPIAHAELRFESERIFSSKNGGFSLSVKNFPVNIKVTAAGFTSKTFGIENPEEQLLLALAPMTEKLSEVVVKGKTPKESTKDLEVLSQNEIESFSRENLMEALSSFSGVFVQQGAMNTNKISIRGIGSRSQYSSNRIKVNFEGIPITSAAGVTAIDDIPPAIIGRMEVIKGPNSSLYGAGLGGVLNLYAAKPEQNGLATKLETELGSFGQFRGAYSASYRTENNSLLVSYNHLQGEGFRENSDYKRNSLALSGKLETKPNNSLSFLAHVVRLKAYIPSSLTLGNLKTQPTMAAPSWKASRGYESYHRGVLGVTYTHEFSENLKNTSTVFLKFKDALEPRPFNILKTGNFGGGGKTRFTLSTGTSKISLGAEYYMAWYRFSTFENQFEAHPGQGSVRGNIIQNNQQNRSFANFFAQWNVSFSEDLKMETGFNLNSTQYEITDLYEQDEIDQNGQHRFKTIFSPRIALTYALRPQKSLYVSISRGFSVPTVSETLTPSGQINTGLEPESGMNYEIGFKGLWFNGQLSTKIAIYTMQTQNLLVADRIGPDQYIGINAGETNHNGLELNLAHKVEIMPSWILTSRLKGAYQVFNFEEFIHQGINYSGNRLPGVPRENLFAGINLKADFGLELQVNLQYTGRIPLNDANSGYTENYSLTDFKAVYAFQPLPKLEMELFTGINNIFNKNYAASIVPNAFAYGDLEPRYYYPGKPRNYFAGFQLGYNF